MSTEFVIIFWIVVAVVTLIALLIHAAIDWGGTYDFDDLIETFAESYGWVTVLVCLGIGGIVFGFIAWIWWAMLIITIVLVIAGVVIGVIIHHANSYDYDEESESEDKKIQTSFKCKNCGSSIVKEIYFDDDGYQRIKYYCEHCDSVFSKRELYGLKNPDSKIEEYDLEDWEEEYFKACDILEFKPHNNHTQKQIDRKKERLENMSWSGEYEYEDDTMDTDEALDYAYDFFSDNEDEIQDYLNRYTPEEIKKRYEYYLLIESIDDDEDDED